jgi:hypothetical protein
VCSVFNQESYAGYEEQDMQHTYDVTMRNVHATVVSVEKQKVFHVMNVCF